MRTSALFLLTAAAVCVMAPSPASAQWTVTMRAMQNPLPVGQCTGIEVTIVDERGFPPVRPDQKQASGWDFDLEFVAASPDAFAWRDERHRFLCARAPTAASATVVARYPGQHLKPMEQVPGLMLQRSIEVTMQGVPAGPAPTVASAPTGAAPGYPAPSPASGYPASGSPAPSYPTPAYPTGSAPYTYPVGSTPTPGGMNPPQPTVGYDPGAVTTTPPGSAPPYGPLPPGQAAPGYPTPAGTAYQPASPGAATQPTQPQPTMPAQPAPPPARNLRQLFQKVGGHAKQTAKDVAGQTMDYTADAANSVIDNTLTSSSDVVKSNVQSTAGGLSGVGQALFNGAKEKQDPKDLAAALASGRAVLRQLRFQEHTATLDPSNGPVLAQLGQALLATPGQYLIEGHVDKTEGNQAQALSEQRAAAVKNALVSSGVSPMQLVATGYGATRPLSGGSSARIEIARTQ